MQVTAKNEIILKDSAANLRVQCHKLYPVQNRFPFCTSVEILSLDPIMYNSFNVVKVKGFRL